MAKNINKIHLKNKGYKKDKYAVCTVYYKNNVQIISMDK